MINYEKSSEINNTTAEKIKKYFDRYPNSNKRIIRICEICGDELNIAFVDYSPLCHKCATSTDEFRKNMSDSNTKRWSDLIERNAQSDRLKQYHIDNPEAGKIHSDFMKQYFIDNPEAGLEHSEIMKNSNAVKAEAERQRGGNDIVKHHYIYDHFDLSLNTVEMTRSNHSKLHRLFQILGYIVPHINIKEENQ